MAVPFKLRGMRSVTILLLTTLAGLPMGAGALIGYFGSVSRAFLGFSLAFSLGAMVYVSVIDLIPSSVRLSSRSKRLSDSWAESCWASWLFGRYDRELRQGALETSPGRASSESACLLAHTILTQQYLSTDCDQRYCSEF